MGRFERDARGRWFEWRWREDGSRFRSRQRFATKAAAQRAFDVLMLDVVVDVLGLGSRREASAFLVERSRRRALIARKGWATRQRRASNESAES